MNKELMKRWVAALRSGEYKQGIEALCQYDYEAESESYCCLGVLQDIKPDIKEVKDDAFLDEDSLKEFMGVGEQDGFNQKQYARWNDEGMPFPEIADRLENLWLNNEENKS